MKVLTSIPGLALSLALAFSTSLPAGVAHAFADDDARRAILDLREQIHQMNEQNRTIRLDFAEQLETLKQEVISLRGQLEQLQYASGQRPGAGPSDSSGIRVANSAEQIAFERPMDMFRSGKYPESIEGFNNFLAAYPASQLASQARFYRGSALFATKRFRESIQGLQELVSDSASDPRAPDALLIIAANQVELNDLIGARAALERIVQDYPDSPAAEKARERLKLL